MRHVGWLWVTAFVGFTVLVFVYAWGYESGGQTMPFGDNKVAYSNSSPMPEPDMTRKTVRIAVAMTPAEFEALQQLQQQYHVIHPDTEIKLEAITEADVYSAYKRASRLGEAADIMLLDNEWINEFAALGYLHALDEMLSPDQLSDLLDRPRRQNEWNGYVWGMPKDVDPYVLVYNKRKLLEFRMLEPPASLEQWNSFLAAAHQPASGKLGLYVDPKNPQALITLLWSFGLGQPQAPSADIGVAGSIGETAAVEEAVEKFIELSKPPQIESEVWKPWELLAKGDIAMMIAPYSEYRKHAQDPLAIAALPMYHPSSKAWLGGRSFVVSSRTQAAAEAMRWIREMNSPEVQVKLWSAGGTLPASVSAYAANRMKAEPEYKQMALAVDRSGTVPAAPDYPRRAADLLALTDKLWKGEIDFTSFLERLMATWPKEPASN